MFEVQNPPSLCAIKQQHLHPSFLYILLIFWNMRIKYFRGRGWMCSEAPSKHYFSPSLTYFSCFFVLRWIRGQAAVPGRHPSHACAVWGALPQRLCAQSLDFMVSVLQYLLREELGGQADQITLHSGLQRWGWYGFYYYQTTLSFHQNGVGLAGVWAEDLRTPLRTGFPLSWTMMYLTMLLYCLLTNKQQFAVLFMSHMSI